MKCEYCNKETKIKAYGEPLCYEHYVKIYGLQLSEILSKIKKHF